MGRLSRDLDSLEGIDFTERQKELIQRLTPLQARFAVHLATGARSYKEAYHLAGGKAKFYDRGRKGWGLWQIPDVQALYHDLLRFPLKESLLQREEAMEMLTKMSEVTVHDVCTFEDVHIGDDEFGLPIYQKHWQLRDLNNAPKHVVASIKSITNTKFGVKVELYSREDAMKQLRAMGGWDARQGLDLTSSDGSMTPTLIQRKIIRQADADDSATD